MFVSIGEASAVLGISAATLRRWEASGRIAPVLRTVGGHRRFELTSLQRQLGWVVSDKTPRKVVGYARVSSFDQRSDLDRQIAALNDSAVIKSSVNPEIVSDLGSGMNFKKRGLRKLVAMLVRGEIGTLVLTHKDRLLRFGSELIFNLCDLFHTKVVVLGEIEKLDPQVQLSQDVLEILTVFSSRVYGARAQENRRRRKALQEARAA